MRERALIVHPRFRHTLADPPVAPADPPAPPTWAELPGEVVELIALHLEQPQDVLALAAVCRDARSLCGSDAVWKSLCKRRYGVPEAPAGTALPPPGFWLSLFKYNHSLFLDTVRCSSRPSHLARMFGGGGPLVIQLN
ncbi:F-box kelch-repeat protein [Micractinium conductrix]|uniref:F-box kelch-repeat protein n=1 Tax=Micractinium conductrix TaxID=554055 RepID=A0A2P6VRT8_9CHLO|nr:F-box kelch-repeat protein [Micractinium conductrix]|eukprot:PSC76803.1 F-box kelch-repeat protein [Micractinium conductrix]